MLKKKEKKNAIFKQSAFSSSAEKAPAQHVAALQRNTCLKFPSLHLSLSQWQEIKGGGGTGGKALSVSKFYKRKSIEKITQ